MSAIPESLFCNACGKRCLSASVQARLCGGCAALVRESPADPLEKAAQEVDEVLGVMRKSVEFGRKVLDVLNELSPAELSIVRKRLLKKQPGLPLKLVAPCPTCQGTGKLGAPGHETFCPICTGVCP